MFSVLIFQCSIFFFDLGNGAKLSTSIKSHADITFNNSTHLTPTIFGYVGIYRYRFLAIEGGALVQIDARCCDLLKPKRVNN